MRFSLFRAVTRQARRVCASLGDDQLRSNPFRHHPFSGGHHSQPPSVPVKEPPANHNQPAVLIDRNGQGSSELPGTAVSAEELVRLGFRAFEISVRSRGVILPKGHGVEKPQLAGTPIPSQPQDSDPTGTHRADPGAWRVITESICSNPLVIHRARDIGGTYTKMRIMSLSDYRCRTKPDWGRDHSVVPAG